MKLWGGSLNNHFPDDEKLYRAVFPGNMYWKCDGTLTSAVFKDRYKGGLSVQRGDGRNDAEVIHHMDSLGYEGAIVFVTVEDCKSVHALVKYAPTKNSKYHSEIHRSNEIALLSQSQAKHLANKAVIVKSL